MYITFPKIDPNHVENRPIVTMASQFLSRGCHQHNDTFNRNYTSNRDSHIPTPHKVNIHMIFWCCTLPIIPLMKLFLTVIRIFLISSGVSMISFEIIIWSNVGILCRSRWTLQILELQHTKWGLIFQWDQVHIFFLLCALFIKPQIIKMMLEKIEFQCKLTTSRDQRKLANKH